MNLPHSSTISRREILRVGALGACGLTLPTLLSAAEKSGAKANACIVISCFLLVSGLSLGIASLASPQLPSGGDHETEPLVMARCNLRSSQGIPPISVDKIQVPSIRYSDRQGAMNNLMNEQAELFR